MKAGDTRQSVFQTTINSFEFNPTTNYANNMDGEPSTITWSDVADALLEGKLTDYLLDSRTATDVIEQVARETNLPVFLVRVLVKGLARLLAARGEAVIAWSSKALAKRALTSLQGLPGAEMVKQALWGWCSEVRETAERRKALDELLAGTTSNVDPEIAKGFSDSIRLALRILDKSDEQTNKVLEVLEQDRRTLSETLNHIQGRLNPQPPLDDKLLSSDRANRLAFGARRVPFVGRETEIGALKSFLYADNNEDAASFRWWLILGSGGLGKSRLAFEFCLQAGLDWRTGFLATDETDFDWEQWQPEQPTLIIIDYVGARAERAGKILRTLARRAQGNELVAPVRILMMERDREDWWDRLRAGGSDDYRLDSYRHSTTDFLLPPLNEDAVWSIVETILQESKKALPDRPGTMARITEIDPERRPLFVALAAESLAQHGTLRDWDRERLLQDVLDRDKKRFWPRHIDTGPYASLLCLATMVGGLHVNVLNDPPKGIDLPPFDRFRSGYYHTMAGATADPENADALPPLAPDIVGEYFVLRHLAGDGTPAQQRERVRRFRDAAWGLSPDRLWAHLERQTQDFPDTLPFELLDIPRYSDNGCRLLWGNLAVNAIARLGLIHRRIDEARALLDRLRETAEASPGEPGIRLRWAQGVVNLFHNLPASGGDDIDEARALLDRLWKIAAAHADEPDIRVEWAKGAGNLIVGHLCEDRLDEARTLFDYLRETAEARPGEPDIRLIWAHSAVDLIIGHLREGGLDEARALLDHLWESAAAHPDELGIRLRWAKGAVELIDNLPASGKSGLDEARALLDRLWKTAAAHADEDIRLEWAKGAGNLIIGYLREDGLDEARALLDRLRETAEARPDELGIRLRWAQSAVQLIRGLLASGKGGLDEARALCSDLQAAAFTTQVSHLFDALVAASFQLATFYLRYQQRHALPYLAQTAAILGREPILALLQSALPKGEVEDILVAVDQLLANKSETANGGGELLSSGNINQGQ